MDRKIVGVFSILLFSFELLFGYFIFWSFNSCKEYKKWLHFENIFSNYPNFWFRHEMP